LHGEEKNMKKERKSTLAVCAVLSAFAIITAGISGCSGFFKGCKDAEKKTTGSDSGSTPSSGTLNVTVYAYCPCARCNTKKWKGMVSTGQHMKKLLAEGKNICAADPDVIPMGSIVTYDGRDYVVADRGSNIKGNTINILLGSHKEVYNFGVKRDQSISFRN
jgi:3D (Asp-Asp-Asp) domain-containing protein